MRMKISLSPSTAVLSQVILINMESLGVVAIINSSLVTEGGGVPLKQIKGAGRGAERLSTEELGTLEERDRRAVGGRRT